MESDVPVVTPVVETAQETPTVVVHTAKDTAEIPPALLHETLSTLNTTLEKMNQTLDKVLSKSGEVVETPMAAASPELPEEVEPEVPAPKDRFVRRGGRRVKR
jgi:hypothetical protein